MSRKKKSQQRSNRLKRIGKRLAAYSAAAAATVVASEGTANAGEIVHEVIPDITVGPESAHGVVFSMLAGTARTTFATTGFNGSGSMRMLGFIEDYPNPYIYTPPTNGAFVVTAGTNVAPLGPSALIDGNQLFGYSLNPNWPSVGRYANLGNWSVGQRAFAGISFDIGGVTHYGWADVSHPAAGQMTLHAFGYNDTPGAASHAIPEPSSIMLLAAGAAGLGLWRRKRSSKAA